MRLRPELAVTRLQLAALLLEHYPDEKTEALLILSDLFDGICSRRLGAAMDVELPGLYEPGALQVGPQCYQRLLHISPATIDRPLSGRRPQLRRSRGFTKAGTLLKHQIPMRTWADWTIVPWTKPCETKNLVRLTLWPRVSHSLFQSGA